MTGGMHGMGSLGGTSIVDFIAFPTAKFTLPAIFTMTGLALGAKVVEGMSSAQSLFPVSVQTVIPISISNRSIFICSSADFGIVPSSKFSVKA